jgi:acetolactate synthase-1/2/3 large subunit
MPDFGKISKSFGINYTKITKSNNLDAQIEKIIKKKRPIVCELIVDESQPSLFKQGYIKKTNNLFEPQPLSEMYPFLDESVANTNN